MRAEQPPTILVVDDDVDICRNLSDILSDIGYDVDVAHEGFTALELVQKKAYDVALLDLKMPGMDGLTLYREIRKIRAGTVALLVTANAGPDTTDAAIAAGAWQVVAKPVEFPSLMKLVDKALGQPLVLVVDDDEDLCANLWDLLRDRGFRVGVAHDAREAEAQLKESRARVVLIDMRIPDCDGGEIYRLVRRLSPQARTVLITGHRTELGALVDAVLAEGADAVCYKPFDIPQLLSTLHQLADARQDSPDGGAPSS